MKRKLLILTVAIVALVAILAISVSAHDVTRKVTLDDGTVVSLYDADGYALTYYLDDNGTLVSKKTVDVISVNDSGVASYSGVATMKVVVANFQGAEVEALNVKQVPVYYYGANGGAYHSYNETIEYIYLPDTLTTTVTNQFRCTTKLKIVDVTRNSKWETMGQFCFYYATGLTEFNYPPKVKTTPGSSNDGARGTAATFAFCTNLKTLNFYDNSEVETFGIACFNNCTSLTSVNLPNSIKTLPDNVFSSCTSLVEFTIPNSVETVGKHILSYCTSLKVIRMGSSLKYFANTGDNSFTYMASGTKNVSEIYIPKTFYATAPDTSYGYQVSYAFHGASANCKFFYCGTVDEFATAKANFLTQKSATSNNGAFLNATVITYSAYLANPDSYATGRYVICEYNSCDAFYKAEHNYGAVADCTADAKCTRNCGKTVSGAKNHDVVKSFAYANGFDNNGVYNCICQNAAYCTAIDGYALNKETAPIVTFKGYSIPETQGVKGINAGFKIDKELLSDYNEINDVDASLTLFMVNSAKLDKILDGETLELASGVKGINVKITSTSYTDIGIAVKGFDATTEEGNYYTLNLITAIAVKTGDGVHYVQAGLKTVANTTQTIDGIIFNTVNADKVYNAVS